MHQINNQTQIIRNYLILSIHLDLNLNHYQMTKDSSQSRY